MKAKEPVLIASEHVADDIFDSATALPDILAQLDGKSGVVAAAFAPNPAHKDYILRALQLIAANPKALNKGRLWVGGSQIGKQDLLEKAKAIGPEENFESWANREFGDQDFCFILNNLEKVDDALGAAVARYIRPYIVDQSDDTSLSVGTFAGRYGFSPIGVHRDYNQHRVLHFHTGPGPKQLHISDRGQPLEQFVDNIADPSFVRRFETIEVHDGGVLNIETPIYHVGTAPELCTNICLLFKRHPPLVLLDKIAEQLIGGSAGANEPTGSWSNILPASWTERPLAQVMTEVLRLNRLATLSNGGLTGRPFPKSGLVPMSAIVEQQLPAIFPMQMTTSFGETLLFARGGIRQMPGGEETRRWCSHLVAGDKMSTTDLFQSVSSSADRMELRMFLQWLYASKAVTFSATQ